MIYLSSHTGDLRPQFHNSMQEAVKRLEKARRDNGHVGRAVRCSLTPEAAVSMIISNTQTIHFETGSAEEMREMVLTLEKSRCRHGLSLHPEFGALKQKRLLQEGESATPTGQEENAEPTGLQA